MKKKTFDVEVTEASSKVFRVKAYSPEEAKARVMYGEGDLIFENQNDNVSCISVQTDDDCQLDLEEDLSKNECERDVDYLEPKLEDLIDTLDFLISHELL